MELLRELSLIGVFIGFILMVSQIDEFRGVKKGISRMTPTKETRRNAIKPTLSGLILFIVSLYLYLT